MDKYYLIGKSLPHTFSPEIHKLFGYSYEVKELSTEEEVCKFLLAKNYAGLNVTIPYKETVMPYLDYISPEAKEAGSVNTIVNSGGKLYGYNTDIKGMELALDSAKIDIKGRHVIILGSGGTAKTAVQVCKNKQAKDVKIVSRNGIYNYQNCYKLSQTEVVINATPVGMSPAIDGLPIDITKYDNLESVFDVVYNPLRTRLVLSAKDWGLKTSGGLIMLTAQAKLARDIFLSESGGVELARQVASEVYKSRVNILLVGMPGSGKSFIGKALARSLNRKFIDIDEEVLRIFGKTPAEIIENSGEEAFRKCESVALNDACVGFYSVIATGGGALTFGINRDTVRENGFVVYIKRDLEKLAVCGRPLSKNLEKLYENRKNQYESTADCIVCNNGEPEQTIKEIIKKYNEYSGY